MMCFFFFFQAEDGIRDAQESRGLGDVYKRQVSTQSTGQRSQPIEMTEQDEKARVLEADPIVQIDPEDERGRILPEWALWTAGFLTLVFGVSMGIGLPADLDGHGSGAMRRVSSVMGWTYFGAWSISFYPQLWMNWRRKSVVGVSFDFILYNTVGYLCYSSYNVGFYYSGYVQDAYKLKHGGSSNDVQANDVFFAVHGLVITIVTAAQCCIYERAAQTVTKTAMAVSAGCVLLVVIYVFVILSGEATETGVWSWLQWLYFLSYIKLFISVIKYVPQVYMNWQRKSTNGWNIYNVVLDFTGGFLSIAQLVLDAIVKESWSSATGNPVKFGLGFASMFFDVIFMVQHYCCLLYTSPSPRDS
eukprot:TRINITY_DN1627_c0_g1_i15.p1 TRINITY_DN1627_c0_g1~~TRINITY_DN1627_c0_g1_i15.p1  ORF type:complete len:359 (+),score=89.06 TRINITY_DN1627_c0_g1_i15:107-1183(+)